jgi:hypothetical protein
MESVPKGYLETSKCSEQERIAVVAVARNNILVPEVIFRPTGEQNLQAAYDTDRVAADHHVSASNAGGCAGHSICMHPQAQVSDGAAALTIPIKDAEAAFQKRGATSRDDLEHYQIHCCVVGCGVPDGEELRGLHWHRCGLDRAQTRGAGQEHGRRAGDGELIPNHTTTHYDPKSMRGACPQQLHSDLDRCSKRDRKVVPRAAGLTCLAERDSGAPWPVIVVEWLSGAHADGDVHAGGGLAVDIVAHPSEFIPIPGATRPQVLHCAGNGTCTVHIRGVASVVEHFDLLPNRPVLACPCARRARVGRIEPGRLVRDSEAWAGYCRS